MELEFELGVDKIVPELESNLDENLAIAPAIEFIPQLSLGEICIANCSKYIFELHSSTQILNLTFVADQILGIERKLNSILIDQKMDSNIVNYQFMKNTANCLSRLSTKGYLQELTSYAAQKTKTKNKKNAKWNYT